MSKQPEMRRVRRLLPELAGVFLSACLLLLTGRVGQPFLMLTAAHLAGTAVAAALTRCMRVDEAVSWRPLLQKAAYVYAAKAAALWLGTVGLSWSLPRTVLLIVAAELVMLPATREENSGTSLRWKVFFAVCSAICAGSLDRFYTDDEKALAIPATFLAAVVALLVYYRVSASWITSAVRAHGGRFLLGVSVLTGGMTLAVAPQVHGVLEPWVAAYNMPSYNGFAEHVSLLCVAVVLFAMTALAAHLILPPARRFFRSFDRFDKGYLAVSLAAYGVVIAVITMTTNAFSHPLGQTFTYDNIFTSDTRLLTQGYYNVFTCMNFAENDIRQMLFGVIGLPMGTLALGFAWVANLLNVLLPHSVYVWHLFGVGLMLEQAVMMSLTALMLRRILGTMVRDSYAKLFTVLFALSYSSVAFTFIVEQYILGLFCLVSLVYALACDPSPRKACVGVVCAAGTMTPSAAGFLMLPLSGRRYTLRELVVAALKTIGLFAGLCLLFGQLIQLVELPQSLNKMVNGFGGVKLSTGNKVAQYLECVSQMLLAPALTTQTVYAGATGVIPVAGRLTEQIIGGVLIALALCGAVVKGRRHGGARMAAYWVAISVAVLVVVGWGAREHGMILYTSYFYWAFLLLFACAFDALPDRLERAGRYLLGAGIAAVGAYNLYGFYQMWRMLCEFYPV